MNALRAARSQTPHEVAPDARAAAGADDRDVLVIDADIEVADGWLDRLRAAALEETQVATVSPFSNDGEVCGYPLPLVAQVVPEGTSVSALNAVFASANRGVRFEVPAPSPFCMYVTRHAIEEAGPLFEDGSIAPFLKRVRDAGLRHVGCADVYVAHTPNAERGKRTFDIDPDLARDRQDYVARDPARPLRRRVDMARLTGSPRPRLLFVSHAWGGGVERHVRDLARLLERDAEVLLLKPEGESIVSLSWLRAGEEFEAWFDRATEWLQCVELLRALGVARMHFHHFHGWPRDIARLPEQLGVPYDVTLHDHAAICAQYHLADENGQYCGEPDERGCNTCIAGRPAQWNLDIGEWRAFFHGVLRGADRVIAPSNDLATRVRKHFPDVDIAVWPHPEPQAEEPVIHKVLILGGLSLIKGLRLFERCVHDAVDRELPLYFRVIGHLEQPVVAPENAFSISGSYADAELARIVSLERPDAFLFLSQVPESFSYTLSAAMNTGLPIVATKLGAFKERLAAYAASRLVPPDAPAEVVNDALLSLVRAPNPAGVAKSSPVSLERAR
ncbi:MAG: glycosyltransferase family 4 protein [Bacillota bacterium]